MSQVVYVTNNWLYFLVQIMYVLATLYSPATSVSLPSTPTLKQKQKILKCIYMNLPIKFLYTEELLAAGIGRLAGNIDHKGLTVERTASLLAVCTESDEKMSRGQGPRLQCVMIST